MAQKLPRHVALRAALLNSLKDGPVRQDEAEGYTEEEIRKEADALGVTSHELDGARYWVRPANLFAIWWSNRRRIPITTQCTEQGGVA